MTACPHLGVDVDSNGILTCVDCTVRMHWRSTITGLPHLHFGHNPGAVEIGSDRCRCLTCDEPVRVRPVTDPLEWVSV